MIWILIAFFLILLVSFLCSLSEAVVSSLTPAFVEVEAQARPKSGRLLKHISDNTERSLSALLTLNIFTQLSGAVWIFYLTEQEYGTLAGSLSAVLFIFLILLLVVILPKTIGRNHYKYLAVFAAYYAQSVILILYPVVLLFEVVARILPAPADIPEVTRDEVIMSAEIGAEEGTLKSKESNIIRNLLKLDKIYVSDIMTPRSVFTALDSQWTVEDVARKYKPLRFSRLPVYAESLDTIIGTAHRYKILEALSQDQHGLMVRDLIQPIKRISERMSVSQLLDYFIKEREHLVLVVDEYNIATGLVTLEDAVETLLGVEIVDEFDNIEDMRKYALEQWQQRKRQERR